LVLPTLKQADITAAARGQLSLDALTRQYIHDHLTYRFAVTEDGTTALSLERQVQQGALGEPPLLNPR
jgi:hypothetical protein